MPLFAVLFKASIFAVMRLLLKPFQFIYVIWCAAFFLATLVPAIFFIMVVSPFGRIRGGNMAAAIIRAWFSGFLTACGIWHQDIREGPHDTGRQYIFVANHISYLDIPVIFKAVKHQPIRILGKVEMRKIPLFGYGYDKVVVTVDRSSAQSRSKSVNVLKALIRRRLSVFIFPEGTFNMQHTPLKDFYDGAFRIAIETQTAVKPILFLDTYDRMHYRSAFSLNPGRCRTVYLEEVPVSGLTVEDTPALKQKVHNIMKEALIRYNASWINENPGSG